MELCIDGETTIDQPTVDDLQRVLRELQTDSNSFVILEDPPNFMQAARQEDGYTVEYQEGSLDRHFGASVSDLDSVIHAFCSYLRRDGTWRYQFSWKRVKL